jgi:hypothetical protein
VNQEDGCKSAPLPSVELLVRTRDDSSVVHVNTLGHATLPRVWNEQIDRAWVGQQEILDVRVQVADVLKRSPGLP